MQYLGYSYNCTLLDRDLWCCSWDLLEPLSQFGVTAWPPTFITMGSTTPSCSLCCLSCSQASSITAYWSLWWSQQISADSRLSQATLSLSLGKGSHKLQVSRLFMIFHLRSTALVLRLLGLPNGVLILWPVALCTKDGNNMALPTCQLSLSLSLSLYIYIKV